MPILDGVTATARQLAARIDREYLQLSEIEATLDQEHLQWSPEEGIPSIQDHLDGIARAAGRLLAQCGYEPPARDVAPEGGGTMVRLRKRIANALTAGDPSLDAEGDVEIDLRGQLAGHLAAIARRRGAIELLRRILDPTYRPDW